MSQIAFDLLIERALRPPWKILLIADTQVYDLPRKVELNQEIIRRDHFEHLRDLRLHRPRVCLVNHRPGCNVVEVNVGSAIGGDQRNLEAYPLGDDAFVAQSAKDLIGLPRGGSIAELAEVESVDA